MNQNYEIRLNHKEKYFFYHEVFLCELHDMNLKLF